MPRTPPQPTVEPEAADLGAVADGTLSVRAAVEFSSINRSDLFELMADGTLDWFRYGTDRRITKASLVKYLAGLRASHRRGAHARTT